MSRIFSVLAIVALLTLSANFLLGLGTGDFNSTAQRYVAAARENSTLQVREASAEEKQKVVQEFTAAGEAFAAPRRNLTLHFYLGVASALLAILVCSISITYFIGTSRWCREVAETYRLSPDFVQRSDSLKRRTFPYALLGIFTVIVIVALGGLSDPSIPWRRAFETEKDWFNATFPPASMVNIHYIAAMIGLLVLAFAFWVQASRIAANYGIIDEILAEVRRIREARGLSTQPSAEIAESKT
ncbi:MAG: hypothetical protein K8R36_03175 [Planctomycetales bacterium]|nr:hypothetical protein [Planctomycetales bacterium]